MVSLPSVLSGMLTAPGRCSSSYSAAGSTSTSWAPCATRRRTPARCNELAIDQASYPAVRAATIWSTEGAPSIPAPVR